MKLIELAFEYINEIASLTNTPPDTIVENIYEIKEIISDNREYTKLDGLIKLKKIMDNLNFNDKHDNMFTNGSFNK